MFRTPGSRWLLMGLLISWLVPASITVAATEAGGHVIHLIRSDDSRVIFEITLQGFSVAPSPFLEGTDRLEVPGFGSFSSVGAPRLPARDFLVGLPPNAGYSVGYRVLEFRRLGRRRLEPVPYRELVRDEHGGLTATNRFAIEEPRYSSGGETFEITAGREAHIRHVRVLPVAVKPATYDPRTGELSLATRIRVEVTFTRQRDLRERGGPPARELGVWNRIYSKVLVNPKQAASWREAPRRRETARAAAPALLGEVVKIKIRETGLHRVRAGDVIGQGFPSGQALSELRLFKSWYDRGAMTEARVDVAFDVVEDPGGTADAFEGDDYLVFYGERLRDDSLRNDPIEKFADHNVYWLGAMAGTRMTSRAVAPGFVSADTASASFTVRARFESDLEFIEQTPPGTFAADDPNFPFQLEDYYYANWPGRPEVLQDFDVWAMRPGGAVTLTAQFLGGDLETGTTKDLTITIENSKGSHALPNALVPKRKWYLYAPPPVPETELDEGTNTLRVRGSPGLEVSLNWLEIEYPSMYRAKGNALEFTNGTLAGDTSLTVTRLNTKNVLLYDVTDAESPEICLLNDNHFTAVGGGFALSFRETFSPGVEKRYALAALDAITEIPAGEVVLDTPGGLIGHPRENGVDVLVIAYGDYVDDMAAWVDYREAQGYRVLMADVQDVFDEFNGGVPNAWAIKYFVEHFFTNGGASYVLLVGDASEDAKHVHDDLSDPTVGLSGPNFVPTQMYSERVDAFPFFEDEVVTTDKWYVFVGNDNMRPGDDFLPDLIIGRLPAGSETEMQLMLSKIFGYEQPTGQDFWRRRMIRVADNAWSWGFGDAEYKLQEVNFEYAEEAAADTTEASLPGGFDVVRFYLSNRIEHPPPYETVSPTVLIDRTREGATPALLAELNQGATVVSVQAHMNRFQICHEWLFSSSSYIGNPDHRKLQNTGKPFVVFGMGCHLSDYAIHKEFVRQAENGVTGDCLSELLLLRPNAGAVGTYGSTGFEFLIPNREYTRLIAQAWYTQTPTDTILGTDRAQARWILGELMTQAEIVDYALFRDEGPIKRYHILGDPLLRMDGGPPRFTVTVDGQPVNSGDVLRRVAPMDVRAVVVDEVAIEDFTLEIAGGDSTHLLTRTPLVDANLSRARKYEVRFQHEPIVPQNYDIVLRAHQAVDTTGAGYHVSAEFALEIVTAEVALFVDGDPNPIGNGTRVPPRGDYVFRLEFPVFMDESLISIEVDSVVATGVDFSHPSPGETTTWLASFKRELSPGRHEIAAVVDQARFGFDVVVSSTVGMWDVIAFPNPFTDDGVHFVFTNELPITGGGVDLFTTTGKRVAHVKIAPSNNVIQNTVFWDGRDWAGDPVANGTYLYVISIDQGGQRSTARGKLVRMR